MENSNKYSNPEQDYMEVRTNGSILIWEDEPLMDVLLDTFPDRYTPLTEEARLQHDAVVFWNRECDRHIPEPIAEFTGVPVEA